MDVIKPSGQEQQVGSWCGLINHVAPTQARSSLLYQGLID